MIQYIDKAAAVAEIENRIKELQNLYEKEKLDSTQKTAILLCIDECKVVLSLLDTLEIKEMDLKKELSYEDYIEFFKKHPNFPDDWGFDEAWSFAKYFFELGLKVTQKAENNIILYGLSST